MEHNSRLDQIAELLVSFMGMLLMGSFTWAFLDALTAPTGSARESEFLALVLIILTGITATLTLLCSYALRMCISREIQWLKDKLGTWRSIR